MNMFSDGTIWIAIVPASCTLALFLWVRFIPNDRIGIVEKRWSLRGSVASGLIALDGQAGFAPEVLRGGLHCYNRFQYAIHTMPLVTIPQGHMGYVFARDGEALPSTQTLASNVKANDFQNVREFLNHGGQRGPQRKILREGTYAINLAQFVVITEEQIYFLSLNNNDAQVFKRMADLISERSGFRPVVVAGTQDLVGVVTIQDGPSLPQGEIIAPVMGDKPEHLDSYHNNFQDPEKFLIAGGSRGRQLQVLVEGTYYINRLFATVELLPKTVVEVGTVAVVVSYTGDVGDDLSGSEYKHGELVSRGHRGVWNEPLMPGKYAFNTFAGKVAMVPTTNFILKWNKSEVGVHRFDENLSEISLITKDAFEPLLPLSVVVHIDYRKAPLVIQRFGDIKRLVDQTLDPMVSAYFKNIGQTRTLIQLLQERSDIQRIASREMQEKFAHYNLELEEVLIGTPSSAQGDTHIEVILQQLRARQIAEEQVETYGRQQKASSKERELREAEAIARQQQRMTESDLEVTIQGNQGRAEFQLSLQRAAQVKAMAEAEASKIRVLGEAEADKIARVGMGQAVAIEEQVRAYGGPKFQLTHQVMSRFAEAIESAHVDVVPKIVINNGASSPGSPTPTNSAFEALFAMLLSDRIGEPLMDQDGAPGSGNTDALRQKIRQSVLAGISPQDIDQKAQSQKPST